MSANRPPLPVALLPALGFAVLAILAERSGFDLWVADRFADGSAGFPYAHRWWSEQLMHDGAQWLVRIVAVALLAFAILRRDTSQLRPLLYLIVCLAVTTGSVGWIKHATIKSCPWDLQRYGGVSAYVELGDAAVRASGVRPDHCFPGAHSSSAFAFFGLYFLALRYRRAAARRVLALVLLTGLSFAATQWLRGAHFVSHDLWSAAIGWLVAVLALPLLGNRTESDQRSGRYIEPEESSRVV